MVVNGVRNDSVRLKNTLADLKEKYNDMYAPQCCSTIFHKYPLSIVSFGYLRSYNVNPNDIGYIIAQYIDLSQ